MAIQSFASSSVARFFREGRLLRGVGWANVAKVAARKLDMLDYAAVLTDLASPPGNRIEALKGNLRGSTASASTTNGESSSAGRIPVPPRSTSATTTEGP
jgi:plasmid maintenance system killer protein